MKSNMEFKTKITQEIQRIGYLYRNIKIQIEKLEKQVDILTRFSEISIELNSQPPEKCLYFPLDSTEIKIHNPANRYEFNLLYRKLPLFYQLETLVFDGDVDFGRVIICSKSLKNLTFQHKYFRFSESSCPNIENAPNLECLTFRRCTISNIYLLVPLLTHKNIQKIIVDNCPDFDKRDNDGNYILTKQCQQLGIEIVFLSYNMPIRIMQN